MRSSSQTDQETKVPLQSVALIGLGQSPRGNMADEISILVNHPMETHEFGLLDSLSPKNLNQLKTLSEIEFYCPNPFGNGIILPEPFRQ